MADQVTMTPDNSAELLEAAAAAQHEADGTTPTPPETPAEPVTPDAEGEENVEDTPTKVEGLEIEVKEEEAETEPEADKAEGDDGDAPLFDMAEVFAEYAENGALAPETNDNIVKALEQAGFGDQAQGIIDQYMAGATATVASVRSQAFEVVGGEQQYGEMIGWALENLPASEVAAFNEAVANPAMVPLAVRGLHAQYQAANGGTPAPQADVPARVAAGANVQSGLAPVRSIQQIAEITSDPRYDSDPAWRASQDARIKASMDAGIL